MPFSGSQITQVGAHMASVAKKQGFISKASEAVTFIAAWAMNANKLIGHRPE